MHLPTLDTRRQAEQQALLARGGELQFGSLDGLPWAAEALVALQPGDAGVLARVDSGLSSQVLCLQAQGRRWALKRRRPQSRVRNVDGELSFLNELLRRSELAPLALPGVQPTQWASLQQGLVLAPWIDGAPVKAWDARCLQQLFESACRLWFAGFFEWDLCAGNVLDDGHQLQLFDFGYCYRFDPQRQLNSAGQGDDEPLFHPVERFESRCYAAVLMAIEQDQGQAAALAAFRVEKQLALAAYEQLLLASRQRGAAAAVLDWLQGLCTRWRTALQRDGDALAGLYLAECWRSHVLDLDDDLRGRSCTAMTLRRADWLLDTLTHHGAALQAQAAFFWGDERLSPPERQARYTAKRGEAQRWQLKPSEEL